MDAGVMTPAGGCKQSPCSAVCACNGKTDKKGKKGKKGEKGEKGEKGKEGASWIINFDFFTNRFISYK